MTTDPTTQTVANTSKVTIISDQNTSYQRSDLTRELNATHVGDPYDRDENTGQPTS